MDAAYRAPIGLKLTKSPSMVEWFTQQLELQHDGQHNGGGPQHQCCLIIWIHAREAE